MPPKKKEIRLKRIYEPPAPDDGFRILVDRLWPRGLSKEAAHIDMWLKDLAPSDSLREWFGHDPEKWPEFRACYFRELRQTDGSVDVIREKAKGGPVTLLFGAADTAHNNAVALKEYLEGRRAKR